jgi:hypothetical protein
MMKVTARTLGNDCKTQGDVSKSRDDNRTKKWQQQGLEQLQRQGIIGEPKAAERQETARTLTKYSQKLVYKANNPSKWQK